MNLIKSPSSFSWLFLFL